MQYILGAYSQLPAGSSRQELETLLAKQIKPLLTMIYRNSNLKLLFRLSVFEYEYIEQYHPEVNMLINDLCRKGQMEILSSCYHDVILSMLPAHERPSHIEKTTNYVRKHFTKKPRGFWAYNQVFNASIVPLVTLCGLNYMVISTFNQITGHVEFSNPCYTDELGKHILILPVDDRFSKETAELYRKNLSLDKYLSNMKKLARDTNSAITTIMLNMDQMMATDGSAGVFELLYSTLGDNSTLPSVYIEENEIARTHYLPTGLYGRDYNIGKATSINQLIYENPKLSRNYGVVNMLRDVIRDSKKNIEDRKNMETLLMKASSASLYFPDECRTPEIQRFVNRYACEIESILSRLPNCPLPDETDLDFDRVNEFIIPGKSHIAYLSRRGAVLNRFVLTGQMYDVAFHSGEGLFGDSFINSFTQKEMCLCDKTYEVTPLDKRRLDFFAKAPLVQLGRNPVILAKRYKFRQSTVIAEIEIENVSDNRVENFIYECSLNIAMPSKPLVKVSDSAVSATARSEGQVIALDSEDAQLAASVVLSEPLDIEYCDFEQNTTTWLGDKPFYEYTQLKIQKKLSLGPSESARFSIGLRIEKRKEKKNDTSEQSAP